MKLTDAEGGVVSSFAYGTYGELLSGSTGYTRFLYNGQYGVTTDDNGLYYMRQRYYSPELKRFINQDVIRGSLTNSQSLNRYSYVQGNPVNYMDPFGLSPLKNLLSTAEGWHLVCGTLSLIPVIGVVGAAFDALIYLDEGNNTMALISVLGSVSVTSGCLSKMAKGTKFAKAAQYVYATSAFTLSGVSFAQCAPEAWKLGNELFASYHEDKEHFFENNQDKIWKFSEKAGMSVLNTMGMVSSGIMLGRMLKADGVFAKIGQGLQKFHLDNRGVVDFDAIGQSFGNKGGRNSLNGLIPNQGYSSFPDLKEAIGSAGKNNDWHHIVEQSQINKSGFKPELIHNTNNIIAVDHATHMKITGYYNTKSFRFTGGLSVRDWLAGQSYEEQYRFGLDVLRKFGVIE